MSADLLKVGTKLVMAKHHAGTKMGSTLLAPAALPKALRDVVLPVCNLDEGGPIGVLRSGTVPLPATGPGADAIAGIAS